MKNDLVIKSNNWKDIDINDTFFDSLRKDYKNFNNWLIEKCINTNRKFYYVKDKALKGICIYKLESDIYDMNGKIMKLCTFKTKPNLGISVKLYDVFIDTCIRENVNWVYFTTLYKKDLILFFEKRGFKKYYKLKDDTSELIYRLKLQYEE